jgi:hypothetical protein
MHIRSFTLFVAALFFLASCNNTESTPAAETAQVKGATTPADPLAEKVARLRVMEPLSLDSLASFLPSKLKGIAASNRSMSTQMGHGNAHADYLINRQAEYRITVFDCGGASGSALFSSSFAAPSKKDTTTAQGYSRRIELEGTEALETFEKESNATTLRFMHKERVLVMITARNLPREDLLDAAAQVRKQ